MTRLRHASRRRAPEAHRPQVHRGDDARRTDTLPGIGHRGWLFRWIELAPGLTAEAGVHWVRAVVDFGSPPHEEAAESRRLNTLGVRALAANELDAACARSEQALHEARARFMVDTDQGLTKTYNGLKDPACNDARVLELRALHEAMDRAVLAAYGWPELAVPPYCPRTDPDRAALKTFTDKVIDRLYALNAERAAAAGTTGCQAAAPATKATAGERRGQSTAEAKESTGKGEGKAKAGRGKKGAGGQGELF